jgi:AraC family transcriptional regulator
MLDFFARGRDAPFLREVRARQDPPVPMIENAHPPGRLSTPPVRELMISQSTGSPFRFHCDSGAGAFSGWAHPREFVLIAPQVPGYCQMHDPARMHFIGIPAGLARACLERGPDDPLDFAYLHTRPLTEPLIHQSLAALWQEMGRV